MLTTPIIADAAQMLVTDPVHHPDRAIEEP